MAGQEDVAFQTVEKLESELQPPYNMFASFGYMSIYLELEDADKTEEALKGVESAIETLKWEIYRPVVFFAQGRIHEFRGEYKEAISDFQKQLELSPTNVSAYRFIGRCYRKLKDYDEAAEYLQRSLKIHPFGPSTNYELALLYSDMGETEKALEHLQATLDVWKNADPEYKPAKLAREKLAELQS
ncbi:tetratricopeptide repeat protein [candidate division KSB1 bacterium]|nr:tetratricopeptide repeat protein [candidate division KSB1 bacterium]